MVEIEKIKHTDQLSTIAFLKDSLELVPIDDGHGGVITDFPVKVQAYAGYDPHACFFKDAEEFSEWLKTNIGVETTFFGSNIFWGKISGEQKNKMRKYLFFQTIEQVHCSVFSRKAYAVAV